MSERHEKATERNISAANFGGSQLFGTADWYVVQNARGQKTQRRQKNIKPTDTVLGGPYETYDQAKCETY
jgi:hypothetical protein